MIDLQEFKNMINYLKKERLIFNDADFASKVGKHRSYISEVKSKKRTITEQFVIQINEVFPIISLNWLLTGEGSMLQKDELEIKASEPCEMSSYITYRLPISALAGSLANFAHSVYKNQLEKIISPIKDVDYSMPVYGDSMQPDYPNGCEIFIKKVNENSFIRWGETYVLDTDNGVVIKNVFEGEDKNYVRCVSINEKYPEFQITKTDIHGWYKVLIVLIPKQN